jgi:hypothetical protein
MVRAEPTHGSVYGIIGMPSADLLREERSLYATNAPTSPRASGLAEATEEISIHVSDMVTGGGGDRSRINEAWAARVVQHAGVRLFREVVFQFLRRPIKARHPKSRVRDDREIGAYVIMFALVQRTTYDWPCATVYVGGACWRPG